jgi:hypothetical protein
MKGDAGTAKAWAEISNAGVVCPEEHHYFAVYPANQKGDSKDAGFVVLIG